MNVSNIFDMPVDSEWYDQRYASIKKGSISAQDHYDAVGREAGFYPNAFVAMIAHASKFVDREWYLIEYPDVKEAGQDPSLHYVLYGRNENRSPNRKDKEARLSYLDRLEKDAGDFDEDFYLKKNPDVAVSGMSPFYHYIMFGRPEGRAPNLKELHQRVHDEHRPFINMAYELIVGRKATNDELVKWTQALMSGVSHYRFMKQLSESGESRVRDLFARLRT